MDNPRRSDLPGAVGDMARKQRTSGITSVGPTGGSSPASAPWIVGSGFVTDPIEGPVITWSYYNIMDGIVSTPGTESAGSMTIPDGTGLWKMDFEVFVMPTTFDSTIEGDVSLQTVGGWGVEFSPNNSWAWRIPGPDFGGNFSASCFMTADDSAPGDCYFQLLCGMPGGSVSGSGTPPVTIQVFFTGQKQI